MCKYRWVTSKSVAGDSETTETRWEAEFSMNTLCHFLFISFVIIFINIDLKLFPCVSVVVGYPGCLTWDNWVAEMPYCSSFF